MNLSDTYDDVLKRATELDWDSTIPFDSTTTSGTLSTGLKYFVKANSVPLNRVHLRMVVKVGSVHEQPMERGFAHLIEHLVFRLTESFKDNEIQRYLSSLGAKPGADSNAATFHDYTSFGLNIPVDERTIDYGFSHVDMGIKVLAEMAMKAQFTERILEQERRIVMEECRLNQTNIAKRNALVSKAALGDTPYANASPIGNMDTLRQCTIDQLLAFYHKWYQPANMAIIAVGGFQDASIVVELIERHFSGAVLPPHISTDVPSSNVREALSSEWRLPIISPAIFAPQSSFMDRSTDSMPRNYSPDASRRASIESSESPRSGSEEGGLRFCRTKTKDDSQSHVILTFRHVEAPLIGSLAELKTRITIQVLSWLLNNRANLLVNAYLGRLIDLVASESRLTSTIRAFEIGFSCTPGCELETLHRVITEIERLKRFLIADEDMELIKTLTLELCERESKIKSLGVTSDVASEKIAKHFLYNESFEGTAWTEHIWKRVIDNWTTADFQIAAQHIFDMKSAVLFVSLPDIDMLRNHSSTRAHREHNPSPPTSDSENQEPIDVAPPRPELSRSDFIDVIKGVEKMELDPIYYYKMPKILQPDQIPDPGRIVSVTNKGPNCTIYTLENGARVQLNSVEASEQKNSLGIDLELNAEGGLAEFWCAEGLCAFHSALVSNAFAKYISVGGVAMGSSPVELGVILVQMETYLFERRARFSALPARLETMLQIIYCLFMNHPANWKEDFCQQELDLMLEFARTARSPEARMRERAISLSWNNHPLIRPLNESDLKKVSIEAAIRFFERAWSNPAEFLFRFSGDFSTPELQQRAISLISRYIGSVPERLYGAWDPEARSSSLVAANSKLARSVRFRKGARREVLYDGEEGTARVLLCFPIPSFKTSLEFEVSEVVTLMLETYLFQILRSHLARVYSVSVSTVHHFGPFFPGDASIQFICDPRDVPQLIDCVFDAIEDLQLHGPSHRLLESSRNIYRKQHESSSSQYSNRSFNTNIPSTNSSSGAASKAPSNPATSNTTTAPHTTTLKSFDEHDGINTIFGTKAATRDIDLLLDNKLAKWLFTLMFPLDNYVQLTMLPESYIPPKPQQTWTSPLLFAVGAVAVASTAFAAFHKLRPLYSAFSSNNVNSK